MLIHISIFVLLFVILDISAKAIPEHKLLYLKQINETRLQKSLLDIEVPTLEARNENMRNKRQSDGGGGGGAGKYSEAADMNQIKMLRLFLQMIIKNLSGSSYYGGSHPLHKDVPKAIMNIYRHVVSEFLFPPVGEDKVNQP